MCAQSTEARKWNFMNGDLNREDCDFTVYTNSTSRKWDKSGNRERIISNHQSKLDLIVRERGREIAQVSELLPLYWDGPFEFINDKSYLNEFIQPIKPSISPRNQKNQDSNPTPSHVAHSE